MVSERNCQNSHHYQESDGLRDPSYFTFHVVCSPLSAVQCPEPTPSFCTALESIIFIFYEYRPRAQGRHRHLSLFLPTAAFLPSHHKWPGRPPPLSVWGIKEYLGKTERKHWEYSDARKLVALSQTQTY